MYVLCACLLIPHPTYPDCSTEQQVQQLLQLQQKRPLVTLCAISYSSPPTRVCRTTDLDMVAFRCLFLCVILAS
uniref:Putative secreted protein n=1 Tax=Anopheles marajoara TaxID=58244 RepID=A0A2M4CDF4_9DIPT